MVAAKGDRACEVLEGVLDAVRARYVYWGSFVLPTTYFSVHCVCFLVVQGSIIAHNALCHLTAFPKSLSWLPAGSTVTYSPSNGDRVPATVISASECKSLQSTPFRGVPRNGRVLMVCSSPPSCGMYVKLWGRLKRSARAVRGSATIWAFGRSRNPYFVVLWASLWFGSRF